MDEKTLRNRNRKCPVADDAFFYCTSGGAFSFFTKGAVADKSAVFSFSIEGITDFSDFSDFSKQGGNHDIIKCFGIFFLIDSSMFVYNSSYRIRE